MNRRSLLSLAASIGLIVSLSGAAAANAAIAENSAMIASFEAALDRSRVEPESLAKYDALGDSEKLQFIEAVTSDDPSSLPGVTVSERSGISRVAAEPGELAAGKSGVAARAVTYNVHQWWSVDTQILGIPVGYARQDFNYQTGNNVVQGAQDCKGTYTGFSGFWSISPSNSMWVAGGTGLLPDRLPWFPRVPREQHHNEQAHDARR